MLNDEWETCIISILFIISRAWCQNTFNPRITQSWFHILWHPTSEDLFWVRSEGANCFWRSWPFRGWGPTTHMPMIWRSAWSHPSRGSIGPSDRGDALAWSRIILFLGWKHMQNRKHSSRAVNSKLPTSRIPRLLLWRGALSFDNKKIKNQSRMDTFDRQAPVFESGAGV